MRLPAHLEISGLIRAAEAAGGFAAVVSKGERDAGTILILAQERGKNARLWERLPQMDGARPFTVSREEDTDNPKEFAEYVSRRGMQDPDCWVLELDVPNMEQFIAKTVN